MTNLITAEDILERLSQGQVTIGQLEAQCSCTPQAYIYNDEAQLIEQQILEAGEQAN